ncbi:nucleoside-diphosphate sugar epimerase/dehydratase [Clostridium sp. 'White wine YQ']|uniref:nucleoside-diphosphate sugar epimerase/dehydratase n=1 Tax=Clostridium sp. 'White wine YQ' TaxID=3027474 RepID=UPI00236511AF|nr:hypothetical protein [Clostridium sp. 'White wine YQ']MDD7794389.1 hypothetical protein [Clostridium sp. 'White wine YQ']
MDTFLKLEMMAKDINILIKTTSEELKYDVYSTVVIDNINLLISTLVELNEGMKVILSQHPENNLTEGLDKLAEDIEAILYSYESNDSILIEEIFIKFLTPRFEKFYKDLDKYFFKITGVKKAIVLGVNDISIHIEELVDCNKCRIVAFISDNSELQGKYINDIPIHKRDEIPLINYEYLIITDYFNCNLENKIIVNINDYIKYHYDYEVFRAYSSYFNCTKPLDGFITGISYAEVGIDTAQLSYDAINVAVSSQDLFYDYQWAKMILNNQDIGADVRFAIIGMSYYSFEYDLSKSSLKDRVYKYYPFFRESRNHTVPQEIIDNYVKFEQASSEIFKKDYNSTFYNLLKAINESSWNNNVSNVMNKEKIEKDKTVIERDCNKDYPETVVENTKILREYILLLKSKKIKPIIVICPTSKVYYTNFSERIKEEYKSIMNKMKDEFDVEILDYFDSTDFLDEDFYHISHLNKNGAIKFTKLLNDRLINII